MRKSRRIYEPGNGGVSGKAGCSDRNMDLEAYEEVCDGARMVTEA